MTFVGTEFVKKDDHTWDGHRKAHPTWRDQTSYTPTSS